MNKAKKLSVCITSYLHLRLWAATHREEHAEIRNEILLLNTEMGSDNLGDGIIMHHCRSVLYELLPDCTFYEVATHEYPTVDDVQRMKRAKAVIVCGTNFLAARMELSTVWKYTEELLHIPNLVLLGVGWGGYGKASPYTAYFYRKLLRGSFLHSVRDEYTLRQLRAIGVKNVCNTSCVTMWGLGERCAGIRAEKGSAVVTTITGYYQNTENDRLLFDILRRNYAKVYFWPQGESDLDYMKGLVDLSDIHVLNRTIQAYEDCLRQEDIDYVGTRLHGGIYAMQHGRRTIIIGVDNRAVEITRDTNLPLVMAEYVADELEDKIRSTWSTELVLDEDAIARWKTALKEKLEGR